MNYIKHLTGFFEKVSTDYDLNPTHISLYMAIFQQWNQNRFQNPISISRDELMRISKIASTATYHKCIKELSDREYVSYKPSFNPFKGSILEVCNLDFYTKPLPKKELKKGTNESKNEQVIEQVLNKKQTSTKQLPYINRVNNSNSLNLDKHEVSKNKQKLIPENLNFDERLAADLKLEKEKNLCKKKKSTKDGNSSDSGSQFFEIEKPISKNLKPVLKQAQSYFLQNGFSEIEAQKFYNYFESNGWLVGGRTKMKDWQAAARNWMLNAKKFVQNENKNATLSVRAESRTVNLNSKHLHVTNQKNYGEAL